MKSLSLYVPNVRFIVGVLVVLAAMVLVAKNTSYGAKIKGWFGIG